MNGKWGKKWRHSSSGLHYGQAVRSDGSLDIDISTSDGKVCLLNEKTLKRQNVRMLDPKKYYSFEDLWNWGIKIEGSKR